MTIDPQPLETIAEYLEAEAVYAELMAMTPEERAAIPDASDLF